MIKEISKCSECPYYGRSDGNKWAGGCGNSGLDFNEMEDDKIHPNCGLEKVTNNTNRMIIREVSSCSKCPFLTGHICWSGSNGYAGSVVACKNSSLIQKWWVKHDRKENFCPDCKLEKIEGEQID